MTQSTEVSNATIRFHLETMTVGEHSWKREACVVQIYINDRTLIDILREVELPHATAEGHPELAGSYMPLPVEQFLISDMTIGNRVKHVFWEEWEVCNPEVLACLQCGTRTGCWPFRVRITKTDSAVIWDEFEQPHRRGYSFRGITSPFWSYDALDPFIFDRNQYLQALGELEEALQACALERAEEESAR